MKLSFIFVLLFGLNSQALPLNPIGVYYQKETTGLKKLGTVYQRGQRSLLVTIENGCTAELKERAEHVFMGSCTVGTGHGALSYFIHLAPQGQKYALFLKIQDFRRNELDDAGPDEVVIGLQR